MGQHAVGGHPVAFGEHNQVAAHHVAAGDADAPAVADDQRARRREGAERHQRLLRLVLLVGDADDGDDEGLQDESVERLGEEKVDGARSEQDQQHRLANEVPCLPREAVLPRRGQLLRAVGARRGAAASDVMPVSSPEVLVGRVPFSWTSRVASPAKGSAPMWTSGPGRSRLER
jgi:hypothetical protein